MVTVNRLGMIGKKPDNFTAAEMQPLRNNKNVQNQTNLINSKGATALRANVLGGISFGSSKMEVFRGLFREVAATEKHPNWKWLSARQEPFIPAETDVRTPFQVDYDRITRCEGFKRYMNKTQVFAAPINDHVSTRIIHVTNVAKTARFIGEFIGLNTHLIDACAIGHDLGHTPFGHQGEKELNALLKKKNLKAGFFHEKQSLRAVDNLETVLDSHGIQRNLNLTNGTRDGIFCHCGEIDENGLMPRPNLDVDYYNIEKGKQPRPASYEACLMKICDKLPFLGEDIEDATRLGVFPKEKKAHLLELTNQCLGNKTKLNDLNSGTIMKLLKTDLIQNSHPDKGMTFSKEAFELMRTIRDYNLHHIYLPENVTIAKQSDGSIERIFNALEDLHAGHKTLPNVITARDSHIYGKDSNLLPTFVDFLSKYSESPERNSRYGNKPLYSIEKVEDYQAALVDYIAGMTDRFALKSNSDIKKISG